ncbi:MAG: type II toxin-antitoxin system PemK/MazF family toxin [Verrucomicrobia bacterium]|nr:type II toxin-antitoxin system PemK/MazF family toxin [Verrucomicrobiota bacterium]
MPNRGEVWLVDLGLAGKTRPALILNKPFSDADRALITVVPHTQALRGSTFEIALAVPFLRGGAFLVQNPLTIPAVKAERLLGRLTSPQLGLVEAGVRDWLGL